MIKSSLLFVFFLVLKDAHANGWSIYVDSMGSGQSDPIGGLLILLAAGLISVFGWFVWGRSSIKYIYVPMALGTFVLFLAGGPERNILLFPIAGLVIGWVIMLFTLPLWGKLLDWGRLDQSADASKKMNDD